VLPTDTVASSDRKLRLLVELLLQLLVLVMVMVMVMVMILLLLLLLNLLTRLLTVSDDYGCCDWLFYSTDVFSTPHLHDTTLNSLYLKHSSLKVCKAT
jgi:hypothetical protein